VDAEESQIEEGLGHEVTVGHGVQGVLEAAGETELGGHGVGIEGQRGTGQGAGAQRRHVHADDAVEQAVDVAGQGPGVGQQVVASKTGWARWRWV